MTAITPSNRNFLKINGFQLVITKTPHLEYFVQDVSIPGFSADSVPIPNPLVPFKEQADTVTYETLSLKLICDEDLKSWEELFAWNSEITFPISTDQRNPNNKDLFSDVKVIVETNHHNSNFMFTFTDAFPTSVSTLELSATVDTIIPVTFSVNFDYTNIKFDRIKK